MNSEHIRIRILFMIYSDQTSKANILIAFNKRHKHTYSHGKLHSIQSFDKHFKNGLYLNVVELKMTQTRIAAASAFLFSYKCYELLSPLAVSYALYKLL